MCCRMIRPLQDSLVETAQERVDLLLDGGIESILYYETHVFLLVIFCNSYIRSSFFEFNDLLGTELLYLEGEVELAR